MKLTTATQIYPQSEADSDKTDTQELLCILPTIKIVSIVEALCFSRLMT